MATSLQQAAPATSDVDAEAQISVSEEDDERDKLGIQKLAILLSKVEELALFRGFGDLIILNLLCFKQNLHSCDRNCQFNA
jgi:hypothetical protein